MPIYEYKVTGNTHCKLCKDKFEVRQGINDEPLKKCPACGAEVKETFDTYAEEEADELGLEGGFAEDEVWD